MTPKKVSGLVDRFSEHIQKEGDNESEWFQIILVVSNYTGYSVDCDSELLKTDRI